MQLDVVDERDKHKKRRVSTTPCFPTARARRHLLRFPFSTTPLLSQPPANSLAMCLSPAAVTTTMFFLLLAMWMGRIGMSRCARIKQGSISQIHSEWRVRKSCPLSTDDDRCSELDGSDEYMLIFQEALWDRPQLCQPFSCFSYLRFAG